MVEVPTEWETLDPEGDRALTEVATQARDAVIAAGEDAEAAALALDGLVRGWRALGERFDGALDTDVRECVGAFFDELAAAAACDLDPETLWAECSLGLIGKPPPPTLAAALEAAGADPAWEPAFGQALEAALVEGPVPIPGLGTLEARFRPARPGTFYASPVDRIAAHARGEQVGMPAQTAVRLKVARGIKAALADPTAFTPEPPWPEQPLAAALAPGALEACVHALLRGLSAEGIELSVGLVFFRRDRPEFKGRNPHTGEEMTIPGKTGAAVHVRRGLKERLTAALSARDA